jgi:UDP-glucose 4-epimerase
MKILITGGAGYIGSHTIIELLEAGHMVVVADNFSNSSRESLRRVEAITHQKITLHEVDICNINRTETVFSHYNFDAIIHFAGLKSVGQSIAHPLRYYRNNLDSTLTILELMNKYGVNKIVFSSSATVYGVPEELPLKETSRIGVGITNPYGWTKFMAEQILRDYAEANKAAEITILRYFNPAGAHCSGLIGEDPLGPPNNLLPYISQVAAGKLGYLKIFGNDYNTIDGTGVRDYIHVVDLARGHLAALEHAQQGVATYNLASGTGTSVLELLSIFKEVVGRDIPYEITSRRPGDVATCYASPAKANQELSWRTKKTIEEMCEDAWRWQSKNPQGFNVDLHS